MRRAVGGSRRWAARDAGARPGKQSSSVSHRRGSMIAMSPKAKVILAREHLERALPAVMAEDYTEAVTWLFVSLEAAVAALAEQNGVSIEPKHWRKAQIAKDLFAKGAVEVDFAPALGTLNEARKEALYEGEEPDLDGQSLEDLATDVEAAVELAEKGAR